jgi:aldehyde dehydrogenase (NAD+)
MGGKNPCIILEDADLELAVGALLGGAFGATGQRCTAMSRAIVVEAIADRFLDRLLARAEQLQVGAGLDEDVFLGPCVSESQMNSVLEYVAVGQREGAHLLCGGQRLTGGDYGQGFFLPPTVFDHVTPGMRIAREEIFGPVLTIHRVPDFEAALEAANDVDYGLTSVIYTNDLARALTFVDRIEAGMAHVNSPWLGGEVHLPFGGTKATGIGPREMGDEVLDFYTEVKAVYINYNTPKRG